MDIPFISSTFIEEHTDYPVLIRKLRIAFQNNKVTVPLRHHHMIYSEDQHLGTMLLMPAWKLDTSLGVKLVNVFPTNKEKGIPSINGLYIHFDGKTGQPQCLMDAKSLTNTRTAAASALASSFLSLPKASSLLMLGTGSLAPELIKAHTSIRPINKVFVWGRNYTKAKKVSNIFSSATFECIPVENYLDYLGLADIISTATMSTDPLVFGEHLRPGQHIDLVGSYLPHMREADDNTIAKSSIFVDTREGATKESGDLAVPLNNGVITMQNILGDLHELCAEKTGRKTPEEITLFKSVGYALEDLVAGEYYYQMLK